MTKPDAARRLIVEAIRARVFPAAAIEVGNSASALWSEAVGTLTFDVSSPPANVNTPFDLASLTKVVATTTVVMELVRTGALDLEEPVSAFFEDWRGADRDPVTVRDLLEHTSGLAARLLDPPPAGRRELEHDIGAMPLEYPPRSRSIYSDLGFILLGFLAADRGGASLTAQFDRVWVRLKPDTTGERAAGAISDVSRVPLRADLDAGSVRLQPDRDADTVRLRQHLLTFGLPSEQRRFAAPTRPMNEDARRGRLLAGDVHDTYAVALGGVAGHAGMFGTAPALGAFARVVLRASRGEPNSPPPFLPSLVAAFTTKSVVPGSSRALGWDTMLPTSSCGARMSSLAFGHVGFTGTSLWIDPARDRYFVLLTNRVCDGGTVDDMRAVRRAFHDALSDV